MLIMLILTRRTVSPVGLVAMCALSMGCSVGSGPARAPDNQHSGGLGVDDRSVPIADGSSSETPSPAAAGQTSAKLQHASASPGWTEFTPSADTRIIYVSSSEGSDVNDGLSEEAPVQTLVAGYSLLRDGFPDWLLLKKGDTWDLESISGSAGQQWDKSGRSPSEPMLVSSYGTGARPIIQDGEISHYNFDNGAPLQYVSFVDLEFYNARRDPSSPLYGQPGSVDRAFVLWGPCNNILVEGCRMSWHIETVAISGSSNITVRRNVITDSYEIGGTAAKGFWLDNLTDLLFEENVLDHNGWLAGEPSDPTPFEHGIYACRLTRAVFRNNIIANSADEGLKARSDVPGNFRDFTIEGNVFIGGGYGVGLDHNVPNADFTHTNGTIRDNVFTEIGQVFVGGDGATIGNGLTADSLDGGLIEGNICVNTNADYSAAINLQFWNTSAGSHRDVTVRNNVVANWSGEGIVEDNPGVNFNIVIENNIESPDPADYLDVNRTVGSYCASLNVAPATTDEFLRQARLQRKGFWRSELTAQSVVRYFREGFQRK